jgi:hypothetical protein
MAGAVRILLLRRDDKLLAPGASHCAIPAELATLIAEVRTELGFRHYALIHHADLRGSPSGRVDIKSYPAAVAAQIIGEGQYRIGWLTTDRGLAKDYERPVETGEMLLYLAMSRILLRHLTRKEG